VFVKNIKSIICITLVFAMCSCSVQNVLETPFNRIHQALFAPDNKAYEVFCLGEDFFSWLHNADNNPQSKYLWYKIFYFISLVRSK